MATPFIAIFLDETTSTQDEARSRFTGEPVLVAANRQTAGRGRRDNEWENADRLVAASLAFRPEWDADDWSVLTLVAGLAAVDVLGPAVGLDWPNDLVTPDGKVGGILAESDGTAVTVGMGVNLHWGRPMPGAAAIHAADPGSEEVERVARTWANRLLTRASGESADWGRAEYVAACSTIGHDVTWEPEGAGRATGIAPDGGLEVDTADGPTIIRSGEVHTVRAIPPPLSPLR